MSEPGTKLTLTSRNQINVKNCDFFKINELDGATNWAKALIGQDLVIHTAARTHIMNENAADPLSEYRRINVNGTLNLARQAASAGVKRFIFISSIKVNGEFTKLDHPFTPDDPPNPQDDYAISKLEAELGLFQIARETSLEIVLIRPPLIYGSGVKGNFFTLIKLIQKRIPFPLANIKNKRSLVSVLNLIDFIVCCSRHPLAANEIFLVSDGFDISTPHLLKSVAIAMKTPLLIFPFPTALLLLLAKFTGQSSTARRLVDSSSLIPQRRLI